MKNIFSVKNLVIFLLSLSFIGLKAQEHSKPLEVTLGALKTELKQNAINFGISYLKSLDSIWDKQDFLLDRDKSVFLITPDLNIQSGNNDAFSSISIKITGLPILFDTVHVARQVTPNTAKTFHTFPFSLGLEASNKFNIVNGIAEFGWVPWYQAELREAPDFLKRTKIGIFIQGGYKFSVDSTGRYAVGGEVDESKEITNNTIFRAKGSFRIDTKSLFNLGGIGVGLVGTTDGWYDFLNSEVYYSIQAKLRLYLTSNQDQYFDFQYQKGSGAPNFNQGEQFGMALTITF